jgi:hypothetical protein
MGLKLGNTDQVALVANRAEQACNGWMYMLNQDSNLSPNTNEAAQTRLDGDYIMISEVQEALQVCLRLVGSSQHGGFYVEGWLQVQS